MDDMFGDSFLPATTADPVVDPAAGFLEMEQESLGSLGIDLGLSPPPAPQNGLDSATDLFVSVSPSTQSPPEIQPDPCPPTVDAGSVFPSSLPPSDATISLPSLPTETSPQPNPFLNAMEDSPGDTDTSPTVCTSEVGGPFQRSSVVRGEEEPECIKKWRVQQQEMIQRKDEEEAIKKAELKEKAKKELEDWKKSYTEELERTKAENRVAEQAFLADVHGLKPGTEWERVARHCDFNSKVNFNKKDRSRMRSVILQLKSSPLMNRD